MITSPYKSKYFQVDPIVLKNAVDDSTWGIDEEKFVHVRRNIRGEYTEVSFTVLISACVINNEELVDYILSKGANVNVGVDFYGNSCAHVAIQHGNLNLLQKLIAHGADLEDKNSMIRVTLLHTAVYRKNYPIVEYLIEQGADVNAPCDGKHKGITPLITAVEFGSKDIAELLLKNGANNISPMILKGIPRKYCYITPLEFFSPNSHQVDCSILKQSTLTSLPKDIKLYYFQRFLEIGFYNDLDNILKFKEIFVNSFPVADENLYEFNVRIRRCVIKILSIYHVYGGKPIELELDDASVSFQARCEIELNHMKDLLLPGTSLSWGDIFTTSLTTLTRILDENSIPYDIDYLEKLFPLYGAMIHYGIVFGYKQRELYNTFIALKPKL